MINRIGRYSCFIVIACALFVVGCSRGRAVAPTTSSAVNDARWNGGPTVVLISIDGLRHDYIDRHQPPTLSRLKKEGASVKGLTPIFPSKTFPNHLSLITGVKAGKHGIVGNEFYEPSTKRHYAMKKREEVEDGHWYQAAPVWNMLKDQGLVTASFFWVGSEAPIFGQRPDYWKTYDGSIPGEERVQQVLTWLQMEESKRPRFITLYFSQVDNAGHEFGPHSSEVKEALFEVDQYLTTLVQGLAKLAFPVHVVVVSDHGMAALSKNKVDVLDEYWSAAEGDVIVGQGSTISLYLKDTSAANLKKTTSQLNKNKNWKALTRAEFPAHWGLDHERIGDILLVANPGRYIYQKEKGKKSSTQGGSHGWEPDQFSDMDGVFIAHGPRIAAGKRLGRVANIHVAPFLLALFGLEAPAQLDGSLRELGTHILRP